MGRADGGTPNSPNAGSVLRIFSSPTHKPPVNLSVGEAARVALTRIEPKEPSGFVR
jgi:hypothetical protein